LLKLRNTKWNTEGLTWSSSCEMQNFLNCSIILLYSMSLNCISRIFLFHLPARNKQTSISCLILFLLLAEIKLVKCSKTKLIFSAKIICAREWKSAQKTLKCTLLQFTALGKSFWSFACFHVCHFVTGQKITLFCGVCLQTGPFQNSHIVSVNKCTCKKVPCQNVSSSIHSVPDPLLFSSLYFIVL
jgi:hypothetical protein